ncbi:hypothetical protein ACFPK5_36310 [Streptomyces beijiangensis]|uniref:hypothetical protein n=1 Tax=Streptomyces beijiangensis TaxID=163361 RepID=UPI0033768A5E
MRHSRAARKGVEKPERRASLRGPAVPWPGAGGQGALHDGQLVQPVTGVGPVHWSGWLPVTEPGATVALAPS